MTKFCVRVSVQFGFSHNDREQKHIWAETWKKKTGSTHVTAAIIIEESAYVRKLKPVAVVAAWNMKTVRI